MDDRTIQHGHEAGANGIFPDDVTKAYVGYRSADPKQEFRAFGRIRCLLRQTIEIDLSEIDLTVVPACGKHAPVGEAKGSPSTRWSSARVRTDASKIWRQRQKS